MAHHAFISYSRNKNAAKQICDHLEDNDIRCWIAPRNSVDGNKSFESQIVTAIQSCKVFLLIISDSINHSSHVSIEVKLAIDEGKPIVPIYVKKTTLKRDLKYYLSSITSVKALKSPLRSHFQNILDHVNKNINGSVKGNRSSKEIKDESKSTSIAKGTAQKKSKPSKKMVRVKRKYQIPYSGQSLSLPCYFPSISSVKSNLSPLAYLKVINVSKISHFLISAYDIYNCENTDCSAIMDELKLAHNQGTAVLLDSGGYERFWKEERAIVLKDKIPQKVKWDGSKHAEILSKYQYHFACSYDEITDDDNTSRKIINKIEAQILNDVESLTNSGCLVPIVHSPKPEWMPVIVKEIGRRSRTYLNPLMIAVPERELGGGIIERAETIFQIREYLNELEDYYFLHILGTGNPLSILLYSMCGADSFDGLEWCQTVVDHRTGKLHHFSQRELLNCKCKHCEQKETPYDTTTLSHNMHFYDIWMPKIQSAMQSNTTNKLVKKYFNKYFVDDLKKRIPKVFK